MKREAYLIEGLRDAARAEWNFLRAKAVLDGGKDPERGRIERIENAEKGTVEFSIRGYIWYGMLEELDELLEGKDHDKLIVRINSGGGSAFSGLEIANRLRGMETHVVTRNESAAMSAAAVIFLSGDEREVGGMGTATMFHGARGFIDILEFGPVEKLEKVDVAAAKAKELDLLQSLNRSIRKMLLDNTSMSEEEIEDIVTAEKQLTSEEALDFGIATGVYEKSKVKDAKPDAGEAEDSAGRLHGILMEAKEAFHYAA